MRSLVNGSVAHPWHLGMDPDPSFVKDKKPEAYLKGTVSRDFCFLFFSWISFPPAPEYHIRTVLNFFENLRRYSQAKVHHRYQRHRWQIATTPAANLPPVSATPVANFATIFPCVVVTGGKFATGVNETGGKFAASANDTGGNLPPVSTTAAANNGNNIRLQTP